MSRPGRAKHPTAANGKIWRTADPTDAKQDRRRRLRNTYDCEKQVVEPVFGQIKPGTWLPQFLLRGVEKCALSGR